MKKLSSKSNPQGFFETEPLKRFIVERLIPDHILLF